MREERVSTGSSGAFLPVLVGRTEAFFLRLFLAAVTVWSVWDPSKYDRMEKPAGIASWGIDLGWIGRDGSHPWFLGVVIAAGVLYVAALWLRTWVTVASVGVLAMAHLLYWTLANSQGNTFHGSNMTTLVLLLQLAAAAICMWREKRKLSPTPKWPGLDSSLLYFAQCAIAGVYVTSAITKLWKSKGGWLLESHYFAKSVLKTWRQGYYSDPGDLKYQGMSAWADWLLHHPVLARLLFAPGFFLELFAFVILWNRKWAFWFGLALVAMHIGIGEIMELHFPEFLALDVVFCVNVAFLLAWALSRRNRPQPSL